MADEREQPDDREGVKSAPERMVSPAPKGSPASLAELADQLRAVRDNPNRSPRLRAWAQHELGRLEELRALERATGKSRGARLAEALRLDHVPTLTAQQRRDVDAAVAKAESDADRIYGTEPAGRNAA